MLEDVASGVGDVAKFGVDFAGGFGKAVTGAVTVVCVIIIAVQGWRWYSRSQSEKAAVLYGALGLASHESLGQSRMMVRVYLHLIRWKTFQLLRDLYVRAAGIIRGGGLEETGTMMERLARGHTYGTLEQRGQAFSANRTQLAV